MSAELYRRLADDCRRRSMQANGEADKAAWLKFAEEWQKLGEEADEVEAARQRRKKGDDDPPDRPGDY